MHLECLEFLDLYRECLKYWSWVGEFLDLHRWVASIPRFILGVPRILAMGRRRNFIGVAQWRCLNTNVTMTDYNGKTCYTGLYLTPERPDTCKCSTIPI